MRSILRNNQFRGTSSRSIACIGSDPPALPRYSDEDSLVSILIEERSTFAADARDTSCSADLPPKRIATLSLATCHLIPVRSSVRAKLT